MFSVLWGLGHFCRRKIVFEVVLLEILIYIVLWEFGLLCTLGFLGYFIGLLEIVFTAEFGLLWLVSVLWGFGLLQKWLIQRELITKELQTAQGRRNERKARRPSTEPTRPTA